MKKVITIASLASVALSADFLGHHAAGTQDLTHIIKDVKAHRYDKLIKDGVHIPKNLALVHADDTELFNFDALLHHGTTTEDVQSQVKDLESQIQKCKEMMASKELIYKTMEENLDVIKMISPKEYENAKTLLENERKTLDELKIKMKVIEKSIKMLSKVNGFVKKFESWIQADDEELFHLDGLIRNGVKPHKDLIFEDQELYSNKDFDIQIKKSREMLAEIEKLQKVQEERLPLIKDIDPALYEELTQKKSNLPDLKKNLDFIEKMKNLLAKHGGGPNRFQTLRSSQIQVDDEELFQLEDHEFVKLGDNSKFKQSINDIAKDFEELDYIIHSVNKVAPDSLKQTVQTFQSHVDKGKEMLRLFKNSVEQRHKLAAEQEKNSIPAESTGNTQKIRKIKIKVDDDELFNLGKLIKEGKDSRESIKNRQIMN